MHTIKTKHPKKNATDFLPRGKKELEIMTQRAIMLAKPISLLKENLHLVNFISFVLKDDDHYGIPYHFIDEVLTHVVVTKVPLAPHYILGTINYRGALIAIIDLKELLYKEATIHDHDFSIIIITYQHNTVGVLVDKILGEEFYHPEILSPSLSDTEVEAPHYILGLHLGKIAILKIDEIFKSFTTQD
jgi:purine-binding chemotaxis protein CheW